MGGGALQFHRSPEFLRPEDGGRGQRTGVRGSFVKPHRGFMNTARDRPGTVADFCRNSGKTQGTVKLPGPLERPRGERHMLASGQHMTRRRRSAAGRRFP